jgi:glycosyltransferase involved in cell wall biosynthesis
MVYKSMKNVKVLFLTRYSYLGASSRLRSYQYIHFLARFGIEARVFPLFGDTYIKNLYTSGRRKKTEVFQAYLLRVAQLLRARHFDLLWIEKELFPWLPAWGESLFNIFGIPYVVDYDDAIFHNYDLHPNRLVRFCLGTKIDQVMRRAAVVIVGNDYLGDRARRAGAKRVENLPTVVDLNRYQVAPKTRETPFTIGWIGSPMTAKYLNLIWQALYEMCNNGKAKVVLVGSGRIISEGVPVEIRPWLEKREVEEIQSFDIGIMPLPDEPWTRGKCGYKLIQYMACGLPVVASPVGVNQQIVEHDVNGFLASNTAEWEMALNKLSDSPFLRAKMGRAGRKKVEERYNIQVTAPRLAEILRSAAKW